MKIIELSNGMIFGEHEPGNGTKYTALAIPIPSITFGSLGRLSRGGWLVISGLTRKAYLFQYDGFLHDHYIKEKLGGSQGDYPYFGDLIRRMLKRETYDF